MRAVDVLSGKAVETAVPFFTQYVRPDGDFSEVLDQESITEKAYIPPHIQIQDMLEAGIRLAAARKARFDSVELGLEEAEDLPLDVARNPGADIVDVQRAADAAKGRLDAVAAKKKEAEDAQSAVQEQEKVKRIQDLEAEVKALKEGKS